MSRHFDRKAASGFAATVWNTYDVGQTSNVTSIFIPLTPALNTTTTKHIRAACRQQMTLQLRVEVETD